MMQAQDFPLISHSPRRWAEYLGKHLPIEESIIPLGGGDKVDWNALGNRRIVSHANWLLMERGIRNRHELRNEDNALLMSLRRRGLLDEVHFMDRQQHRRWGTDEELLAFAQSYIDLNGITNSNELQKRDGGLNHALRRRSLMDRINFKVRRKIKSWGADEELIETAKRYVSDKGIRNPRQLRKSCRTMYAALERRRLFGEVGFESMQVKRSWGTNAEIIDYAAAAIRDGRILKRGQLQKMDGGLYKILLKRGLLDAVFTRLERSAHLSCVDEVLDAVDSFSPSDQ